MNGRLLINLARDTISGHFTAKAPSIPRDEFSNQQGVFVTLTKKGELRGCIGFPVPIYPLWQGVMKAALAAAFQDPRFSPVTEEELSEIDIEVSVLTVPELIHVNSPEEYPSKIEVGKDGLILEHQYHSGLLLPQVAAEYEWDAEEFLENLSMKAGLSQEAWKGTNAKIYKFQAKIFNEKKV